MLFSKLFTRCLPAVALLLAAGTLKANTYTAIANGDFGSTATWLGGIAPSANLTNDVIDIPAGITVNLTQNVTVSGSTSSLNVDGALSAAPGAALVIDGAAFSGAGSITMDSIAVGTGQWLYSGALNVQALTGNGFTMPAGSVLSVPNRLYLNSGTLDATGVVYVDMPGTPTFIISGGKLLFNNNVVPILPYNVVYTGSTNIVTGDELQEYNGAPLLNLTMNMTGGAGVTLSKDLSMHSKMNLVAGRLRMNGHSIALIDSADFLPGAGVIVGYPTSDFHYWNVGNIPYTSGVRFAADSNTIHNLDADAGTTAKLAGTLHLTGTLTLIDGTIDIDTNEITLTGQNMMIDGENGNGSNYGYLVVRGNGRLSMPVAAGTTGWFPVATPHYFAPVRIIPHTGNNSGMLSVGIRDSVYEDGFTGIPLSATQPMLNATWHISSANTSNINLKIQLIWNTFTGIMVNGFSETDSAYVAHYTNGGWDLHQPIPIGVGACGIGIDSLSLDSVTSLSPFSTFSHNASIPNANPTAITSVVPAQGVTIYPNPAVTTIGINSPVAITAATVYTADGRMVKNVPVSNNTIPVSDLAPGLYYLRFTATEPLPVQQFMKL